MRVFNGDWTWDPVQAAMHLLHVGCSIGSPKVYSTTVECIHTALDAATNLPGGGFGADFDVVCLADVATILHRSVDSAARALLEAVGILRKAVEAAGEHNGCEAKSLARLQRSMKKLEFLVSYAAHHEDIMAPLAGEVRA